jgi:hypothetical protein
MLFFLLQSSVPAVAVDSSPKQATPEFRFAATFTSHAVLQAAPARAVLWGFTPTRAAVTISDMHGTQYSARVTPAPPAGNPHNDKFIWRVALPPVKATMDSHRFTAAAANGVGNATIDDILFGDVWVCSGTIRCVASNLRLDCGAVRAALPHGFPLTHTSTSLAEQVSPIWRTA